MFIGILFIFHPFDVLAVLPVILGIYIIFGSLSSIQLSFELKYICGSQWWTPLIFGVVGTVMGLIMIYNPFDSLRFITMFSGVSLLISGIDNIVIIVNIVKNFRNDKHQKIIDAVWTEYES